MRVARRVLGLTVLLAACSFKVAPAPLVEAPDAAMPDLAVADAASPDLAIGDGPAPDLAGLFCDPNGSQDSCDSDGVTLNRCAADGSGFQTQTCPVACGTAGGRAHCSILRPSGVVQSTDYTAGTANPTITSDV